jgi:hypothetical protein
LLQATSKLAHLDSLKSISNEYRSFYALLRLIEIVLMAAPKTFANNRMPFGLSFIYQINFMDLQKETIRLDGKRENFSSGATIFVLSPAVVHRINIGEDFSDGAI